MRLRQIFDILKNTELKQIVEGEDDNKIVSFMNLAVVEVYSKFNILQEEQIIYVVPDQTRYKLPDNTLKVLQAYYRNTKTEPLLGDDAFTQVPINDINCDESIFTPQPYTLHIPNPKDGRIYSLILVVEPPWITLENIDTLDFFIPQQYLEPILAFAAYRAYKSMNGDMKTEIGSHLQNYMRACNEVYHKGMATTPIITNTKLTERGYA